MTWIMGGELMGGGGAMVRHVIRLGCAVLLSAFPSLANGQRVIPLDPDSPGDGRLILSTGAQSAHESCPTSVLQFSLDEGADPEWTHESLAQWNEAEVVPVVRQIVRQARASLEGPAFDLCVSLAARPQGPTLNLMGGIGGAAIPPRTVVVLVAPSLNPDWLAELPVTIAHEFHHIATARRAATGLDILIREGRAHHFAADLLPHFLHPSARALEPGQVASSWRTIGQQLDAQPRAFLRRFMFGGEYYGGEVPRWAGYTLGYCLARMYGEAHPDLTHGELALVPAQDFIVDDVHCPETARPGAKK